VHEDRLSDSMITQIGIKIETEWSSSPAWNGHMVTHHWETHYFTVFKFITLASHGHSTKIHRTVFLAETCNLSQCLPQIQH